MKDCLGNDVNEGDFVIYVVQGNRHAGIEFGWILEIKDKSTHGTRSNGLAYTNENYSVKIQHAKADGTRLTQEVIDVPAHWREDTPDHIKNYRYGYAGVRGYVRTQEDYDNYYVTATHRDTGKPSTTRLNCGAKEHRLLVTKPY